MREGGAAGAERAPIGAPLEITRGDRGAALMLRARSKGREGESSLSLSLSLSLFLALACAYTLLVNIRRACPARPRPP